MSKAKRNVATVQELFRQADLEGRPLTAEERTYAQGLLDEAEQLGPMEKQFADLGRSLGAPGWSATVGGVGAMGGRTPGEAFVKSQEYRRISNPSARGQSWSTGLVEVSPHLHTKGTLMEAGGYGGGGLVSVPTVAPGIFEELNQPLTVEQCFGAATTNAPTIRYVTEATAVSAAAGVAEGGSKPESTLGFVTTDEQVKKVATFLPISDETLSDAPAIQQFVNGQLMLFVQIETERQLLRGAAGGSEVQGLLTARGVPVFTASTADGNTAEQLFKAFNSMRGSAYIEPQWLIIHPDDYQNLRLLKDGNNQLFGGGPFFGPYGTPTQANASGQVTGAVDQIWNKPTYVTAAVGSGTAVVGTRANAAVWNRGGPLIEVTNSHDNYFQLDLVAMRCERRVALAVYRPKGFVEVRLAY